jgi:hypothetical protein
MQQRQRPSSTPQQELDRPGHIYHSSDDNFSSLLTNGNNTGKWPRSALRKSSISSKPSGSCHRVRFYIGDCEVLPTATPETSKSLFPQVACVQTDDKEPVSHAALDDNGEHHEPIPRKKSSSEALRALSRVPLEEGTVWTVVEGTSEPFLGQESAHSPKLVFPYIAGTS